MKFANKTQNKSIYSPISPEYSSISEDDGSSSHPQRRIKRNFSMLEKRADSRDVSRRVYKEERFGRNRVRDVSEESRRVRYERSRNRSVKFDYDVKSRHRNSHSKNDRLVKEPQRDLKRRDRSRERSRKEKKHKHKKYHKKRRRSSSKSSKESSSDSDEDIKSSSFISEILKNKRTKNTKKILDEVRQTINNELNDENISYTPPLKPEMIKIKNAKNENINDLKQSDTKKIVESCASLDINGNNSYTSDINPQKSTATPTSASSQAKSTQSDIIANGNKPTSSNKSNDTQKPTVGNGNHTKKKGVLDLPMPPQLDISIKSLIHHSIKHKHRENSEKVQKPHEIVKKPSNSIIVSIPLAKLLESNSIEPIIAANFENSQLKKGIGSHQSDLVLQPKEKPSTSNHADHIKEMQIHLQKGAILTPFDQKGTLPQFIKPSRPSIIEKSKISSTSIFRNKSFDKFQILEQVGKGTYGKVFKAIDLDTQETVAMKYIKVEHETEGFPITCLREIKILRQLDHPNVIKLRDIVFRHEKNSTYLVFDYMNHDLLGLRLSKEMKFDEENICFVVKQILEGINYCHKSQIIHRDLKLSNILMNNKGQVKICDFGLSRMWTVNRPYTNKVISLWYRPIELLLGEEIYGPPVDIWSIGCIIFELFRRLPLFNFNSEFEIVNGIYQLCGTPEFNQWPEVKQLPKYKTFKSVPRMRNLKNTLFPTLPPIVIDLVDQMLALNPAKRITAEEALKSNWIVHMGQAERKPLKLPKADSLEMQARGF